MLLHNNARYLPEIYTSLNQLGLGANVNVSQFCVINQIMAIQSCFYPSEEFVCESIPAGLDSEQPDLSVDILVHYRGVGPDDL